MCNSRYNGKSTEVSVVFVGMITEILNPVLTKIQDYTEQE